VLGPAKAPNSLVLYIQALLELYWRSPKAPNSFVLYFKGSTEGSVESPLRLLTLVSSTLRLY
jgi:hypothetical protein